MSELFSKISLGSVELANRLAAPMTRTSATETGAPTREMQKYYSRFADGLFGLVITEGTYIDLAHSQGYRNQPGIATLEHAQAWAEVVKRVQAHGTRIFLQLMHAGALSQYNPCRVETVAPSAIRPLGNQMEIYGGRGEYRIPRALIGSEVEEIVAAFALAGRRAKDAGFDGVEIHGANGYLIDQFLTTYTNRRADPYGTTVEKRVRFATEVVTSVKKAVGSSMAVGIRLSQTKVNDYSYQWPGGEDDAKIIFGAVTRAGADFIHMTSKQAWQPVFNGPFPFAGLASKYSGLPVIANGSLHDRGRAEEAINSGSSVVSLGRAALANPDLPRKIRRAEILEEFDPAMLHPFANLANESHWRASRS